MSRSHSLGLSVVIITHNERANLPGCLASVSFADEIVVVDAESTDGTADLARSAGASVLSHPWDGYANQRQRGFEAANGDWVLWIDADERVSPELANAISEAIKSNSKADGLPRRHYLLGDWLRHGGEFPATQLRLVRRQHATMGSQLVHETIIEEGLSIETLPEPLDHFSTPSLRVRLKKIATYARLAADQAAVVTRRPNLAELITRPFRRTVYTYIKAGGCKDGWRGLFWSLSCGLEQALISWHLLTQRR